MRMQERELLKALQRLRVDLGSIEAVAQFIGCPLNTMNRWLKGGKISNAWRMVIEVKLSGRIPEERR